LVIVCGTHTEAKKEFRKPRHEKVKENQTPSHHSKREKLTCAPIVNNFLLQRISEIRVY
jgi:hypothetical protein